MASSNNYELPEKKDTRSDSWRSERSTVGGSRKVVRDTYQRHVCCGGILAALIIGLLTGILIGYVGIQKNCGEYSNVE